MSGIVRFAGTLPHVDSEWAVAVWDELRGRGVPGPAIGAALTEVESHMAEAGGEVASVFGDPREYAQSLDLAPEPTPGPGSIIAHMYTVIAAALGFYLALVAVLHLGDASIGVSIPALIAVPAFLVLFALVVAVVPAVRRSFIGRARGQRLMSFVTAMLIVVVAHGVPEPSLRISPWLGLAVGVGVVVLAFVVVTRLGRPLTDADVTAPGQ